MDIDGYDGSELAPLNQDNSTIDNSLTANVDEVFNITSLETNDNLNNMGNELNDNSTLNEGNNEYIENMDSKTVVTTPVEPKKEVSKGTKFAFGGLLIFLIIWMILGIIAFITSIVCFGFSGSITEKILGLVLAILFGPFYWLYFYFNKNYCGRKTNSTVKSD